MNILKLCTVVPPQLKKILNLNPHPFLMCVCVRERVIFLTYLQIFYIIILLFKALWYTS